MDIPTIVVILGAALLFVAISGGGIAFKEVSMPRISNALRIILAPIGLVFIVFGIVLWVNPTMLTGASPQEIGTPSETAPLQGAPTVATPAVPATAMACDEFDTYAGGWPSFGDQENGEVGYAGGKFRIAFYTPGEGFHAAWSPNQYTDFSVETLFSVPADAVGAGGGFTLRTIENRWYLVWVYPASKTYVFIKDMGGKFEYPIPLTRLDNVTPKEDGGRLYLQLKVVATGSQFEIWAAAPGEGYQQLALVNDASLPQGHLGPSAPRPTGITISPAETLFEWICISEP
jgi:hypothetical protein